VNNTLISITIITAIYNTNPYINGYLEHLNTLFSESVSNDRIRLFYLMVDDSSNEDVYHEVYLKIKTPSKKYIRNPKNLGAFGSYQVGLSEAASSYIYFLDSDDYIDSSAFMRATLELDQNFDIVITQDSYNQEARLIEDGRGVLEYIADNLKAHRPFNLSNKIISMYLFEDYTFLNESKFYIIPDAYISFYSLYKSNRVLIIKDTIVNVNYRNNSVSRTLNRNRTIEILELNRMINMLMGNQDNKELLESLATNTFLSLIYDFINIDDYELLGTIRDYVRVENRLRLVNLSFSSKILYLMFYFDFKYFLRFSKLLYKSSRLIRKHQP
jgi:glycosyltransferase involved in cell wall biosynthesis